MTYGIRIALLMAALLAAGAGVAEDLKTNDRVANNLTGITVWDIQGVKLSSETPDIHPTLKVVGQNVSTEFGKTFLTVRLTVGGNICGVGKENVAYRLQTKVSASNTATLQLTDLFYLTRGTAYGPSAACQEGESIEIGRRGISVELVFPITMTNSTFNPETQQLAIGKVTETYRFPVIPVGGKSTGAQKYAQEVTITLDSKASPMLSVSIGAIVKE